MQIFIACPSLILGCDNVICCTSSYCYVEACNRRLEKHQYLKFSRWISDDMHLHNLECYFEAARSQ